MKKDNYIFLATGDVPLSSLTTNDFIFWAVKPPSFSLVDVRQFEPA